MLNTNLLTHSSRERPKRSKEKENTFNLPKTESYLMASMNAFSVPVANQLAHHIGGIHRTILVQLFLCKLIDGSSIQEMSILTKDSRNLVVIWNLESAIKLVFVLLPVLKDLTHVVHWNIFLNFTLTTVTEKMLRWQISESRWNFNIMVYLN